MLSERRFRGFAYLAWLCLLCFNAAAGVTPSLTPLFEWSPFPGSDGSAQAGYQLCVYDGSQLIYNTGFVADPSGASHRYTPGAYSGADATSGDTRVSEPLAWDRAYSSRVRYRDTAGRWGDWSDSAPGAHLTFFVADPSSVRLEVDDTTAEHEEEFTLGLELAVPPDWPLSGFSFQVQFDAQRMAYRGYETAGTLSAGRAVQTGLVEPGVLAIAVAASPGGPLAGSGQLLRLRFQSNTPPWQSSDLEVGAPCRQLEGYQLRSGAVRWYKRGDVNRDGRVTPGDAQLAFQAFLGQAGLGDLETAAADLDADGDVTPGDAQEILGLYFGATQKADLLAEAAPAPVGPRGRAQRLQLSHACGRPGETLAVGAGVVGAEGLAAFGFELHFDESRLRFIEHSRQGTASEAWSHASARLLAPGRLRAGGLAGPAPAVEGMTSLMEFHFEIREDAPAGRTELRLASPRDGLATAQLSLGLVEILPRQETPELPAPPAQPPAGEPAFFVLDDFGAVHTGGSAERVELTGGPYFGWNIARALALVAGPSARNQARLGLAVLDGYGALHTWSCERPAQSFYFYPEPGDIAVDLAICHPEGAEGFGFLVLDRYGRLFAGGAADPAAAAADSIIPPLNGVTQRAVALELADAAGTQGWIMDNMGRVHAFGGAEAADFPVSAQHDWTAMVAIHGQLVRVDSRGGMDFSRTDWEDWRLPRLDGGLIVDVAAQPGLGLVALDRFGGLHGSRGALLPAAGQGPAYLGMEAARDLEIAWLPEVGTPGGQARDKRTNFARPERGTLYDEKTNLQEGN